MPVRAMSQRSCDGRARATSDAAGRGRASTHREIIPAAASASAAAAAATAAAAAAVASSSSVGWSAMRMPSERIHSPTTRLRAARPVASVPSGPPCTAAASRSLGSRLAAALDARAMSTFAMRSRCWRVELARASACRDASAGAVVAVVEEDGLVGAAREGVVGAAREGGVGGVGSPRRKEKRASKNARLSACSDERERKTRSGRRERRRRARRVTQGRTERAQERRRTR
mmetsp:Transcript_41553/g.114402  ORF Transcript_41553/g.114402 Transcript_41553/m.114402 type:complete len:230 (+) Transcript_41553:961-1650(+)